MTVSTEHLDQCIKTLEASLQLFMQSEETTIEHEVYRNAVVKGFELTLETSGKLLGKALRSFMGSAKAADALTFKDVFRHAGKHGLVAQDAAERWFSYRDNRNDTAHDYGLSFAEQTLQLIPSMLEDAKALSATLSAYFEKSSDA